MSRDIIVFDLNSGRPHRCILAPSSVSDCFTVEGEGWVGGTIDANLEYIDPFSRIKRPRPAMICALSSTQIIGNGADHATLTGPEGAAVTITGPVSGSDTMDADGIEISSDIPGTYSVTVTLFPYLDAEYTLEITEP